MADDLLLTNDAVGYDFRDQIFPFTVNGTFNETSVHGFSASGIIPVTTVGRSAGGRIVDYGIGVVNPALSASGFVTGTCTTHLFINGASCNSTAPLIVKAAASANVIRTFVNTSTTSTAALTPAVINTASATVAYGDQIGVIWDLQSVGSAAAGVSGKGYYGWVIVRYTAR